MRDPAVAADSVGDPAWPQPRIDGTDAASAFRVPFSIGVGLSLVVWTFVAQLITVMVFTAVGVDLAGNVLAGRVAVLAAQVLALAVLLLALRATGRLTWRLLGPTRTRWRHVGVGLGVGLGGYVLVVAWAVLWTAVVGEPAPTEQMLLDDLGTSRAVVVATYLAVVVLAPLVEEVVFRGVLFQAARRRLGLAGGVLLSAGVFTLVHVELLQPLQAASLGALFLLGAWLAVMFHRTGTLLVPVLGHAVFNAINLTLAVFVRQN